MASIFKNISNKFIKQSLLQDSYKMVRTINQEDIRHLNLFSRITRVNTRFCFKYNEMIIFCVPMSKVSQAVGEAGKNIYELRRILGKRVRIVPQPRGIQDAKQFIENIVKPVKFKDFEINNNEMIIDSGGMQNKAMLLGRNKRRLLEMQGIIRDFFGKEFRVA
jgi:NusA-like KH domain protein